MSLITAFATSAQAVGALDLADAAALGALSDDSLLAAHGLLMEHRRHADTLAARVAGEIARRSPRDAGYSGLAQSRGFGSPGALLQNLAPVTAVEATQLIEAGALMATPPSTMWEAALGDALDAGSVSIAAVDAIRRGLAPVADSAPAGDLLKECERLLGRVPLVSIDELRREARTARDRIDEAGIARREKERRDIRYLKRWVRADGMYQGAFLLDPESGQHLFSALDAVIAPRRAVQFADAAARVIETGGGDSRTTEQHQADALVDMARLAVDADPGKVFGARRPAVRVVVTEQTLAGPGGHGYLEGDSQPISRETIDRHLCDTGIVGVKFDRRMQIIDLGRTQRLFSEPQRLSISVRDGGCIFLNCAKPPSACEVHHIVEWKKLGRTDVRDGVLLCRHHHMLLHNNHWQIVRNDGRYWLKPPRSHDPARVPIALRSKSPLMRELTGSPPIE
ncbi:MAG: DUF222 domain-containing protein [Rhodoglobus sp.]